MSSKFQKGIYFKSIQDFLDHILPEEHKIVACLRGIIFEEIPDVKEKLSYNVPFYSRKKRICFIWPASIPWGLSNGSGVTLGFTHGHLIQHPTIEMGKRKEVGEIHFQKVGDMDEETVRMLLMEALLIDQAS